MTENEISKIIIGKAIEVHRYLGPGLLESAYQKKLLHALAIRGQNIFSKDYTHEFRLSATSTTQKAIGSLINSGIIEKIGADYHFADPFFRWFTLRLSA